MKNAMNLQLGNEVKSLRRSLGITQSALAEKAEISVRYLQEIEAGQVDLRLSVVQRLSKVFRVDLAHFLCDGEPLTSRFLQTNSLYHRGLDELDVRVAIVDLTGELLFAPMHLIRDAGLDWQNLDQSFHVTDLLFSERDRDDFRRFLSFVIKHQPQPTCHVTRMKSTTNRSKQVRLHWQYLFDKLYELRGVIFTLHMNSCPCPIA